MTNIKCSFNINNTSKTLSIREDKPLLYIIREEFGLTGTKLGCGLEQCGSCAVLVDGEKKLTCNALAKDFQNSMESDARELEIDTIKHEINKVYDDGKDGFLTQNDKLAEGNHQGVESSSGKDSQEGSV